MNVLSLFNGMSCGWIALKELNIEIDKYYSSEIDKYAIAQTQLNDPDTIQLGDVTKWMEWPIDWKSINLILAGSPCQGFSFAGKQLAFDDPRSKLFFVFVEILNHCKKFNPDVKFLLENVNMKKDHLRVISEYVGVFPVNINSNLVSAQNRDRWYWTNIKTKKVGLFDEVYTDIPQPKDQGILLKDILQPENEIDEKYYLSEKAKKYILDPERISKKYTSLNGDKSLCVMAGYERKQGTHICIDSNGNINENKTGTITSRYYKGVENFGGNPFILKLDKKLNVKQNQNKASCFCAGAHSGGNHSDMDMLLINNKIRRLTTLEVSRLQAIPDWYKWECSDTQIYKMCGNGWTVKVISHILSFL